MAREFLAQFHHQSFTVGQTLVFSFQEKKLLQLLVKDLEGNRSCSHSKFEAFQEAFKANFSRHPPLVAVADLNAIRAGKDSKARKANKGQCFPNTMIVFDKAEGAAVNLTGKSKG